MFTISINVKQLGKSGRRIRPVPFSYERVPATAEELIEDTVGIMIKAFQKRQLSSKEEQNPEPLSEEELRNLAEIGRISFGYVYNEKDVDLEKAVRTALLAYEDGLVRLFVNEEEILFQKEGTPIELKEGDSVTFVRFAMLAGRMW